MEVLWEVQAFSLFLEYFNICGIYFSSPRWEGRKGELKGGRTCKMLTDCLSWWELGLLNCRMYLPVTSLFRKVSVHRRQSEHVWRTCPLWSDRFSLKAEWLIIIHYFIYLSDILVTLLSQNIGSFMKYVILLPHHPLNPVSSSHLSTHHITYCEMWWQVLKPLHSLPPEYSDHCETSFEMILLSLGFKFNLLCY